MKVAIYINEGTTQLVLTPENDWEKSVVKGIERENYEVRILHGSFYDCQGGWIREGNRGDESLMLRMDRKISPK